MQTSDSTAADRVQTTGSGPDIQTPPLRGEISTPSPLRPRLSTLYSLLVGLSGLGILGYRLATDPEGLDWLPVLVFAGLSLLVQRSSFHFGSPIVHSLAGVIDLAAVLALGPTAGAAVAALSGLTYLEAKAFRHQRFTRRYLLEIPVFNAGLKASMALLAGALFKALAGPLPLGPGMPASPGGAGSGYGPIPIPGFDARLIAAVCAASLLWFVLDHVGWGILDYLEGGKERLRALVRDTTLQAILIELLPLPSSLVVALVYTNLGWPAFSLMAVAIVAVAALAQRWANARNELVQRVAELAAIEKVSRAIAQAQLDVDELCELMYQHASRIVDTTIFQLGLFDGDDYVIKLWVREGQREPQQTFRLAPGVGLVNWLRESKQPILVGDFQKEMDSLPAKPVYVAETPPHSALFVPLVADDPVAGDEVIGTMSIQSFRRNAYGDSDLPVLSAMGNQAAMAIQKARLYAQERANAETLSRRARQLETIGQVSRQVAAIMELDQLFEQTVHLIRESFGYYHVAIYTADRERETVLFQASASAGEQDIAFDVAWDVQWHLGLLHLQDFHHYHNL